MPIAGQICARVVTPLCGPSNRHLVGATRSPPAMPSRDRIGCGVPPGARSTNRGLGNRTLPRRAARRDAAAACLGSLLTRPDMESRYLREFLEVRLSRRRVPAVPGPIPWEEGAPWRCWSLRWLLIRRPSLRPNRGSERGGRGGSPGSGCVVPVLSRRRVRWELLSLQPPWRGSVPGVLR